MAKERCVGPPEPPALSGDGPRAKATNRSTVRDVPDPGDFCVRPETPAAKVVVKILTLKVRRFFVVDGEPFKNRVKSEVTDYLKIAGGAATATTDLDDLEATEDTPEAEAVTVPATPEPEQVDLDSLEDL